MKDVEMRVEDLEKALESNLKTHRAEFEKALDGWKAKVTKTLEEAYNDAKKNKKYRNMISLPQPADHTEDYETAIAMLKHEQRDKLTLSQQEYAQFVLDNWVWKREFTATNNLYAGK